ncbi:MAG: glycosyltransferase [Pirellulales bacterium]
MIDGSVPRFDRDAGSRMTFQYLELLVEMGYRVQFLPDDGHRTEPYSSVLESQGVEVLAGSQHRGCWPAVLRASDDLALVWLARPLVAMKYLDDIRAHSDAAVLYSLVDLHYVREARRARLTGQRLYAARSQFWRRLELSLVRHCDVTLAVSEDEVSELQRTVPGCCVAWLPLYIQPAADLGSPPAPVGAPEVLFVGNFRHAPNVDAVHWLIEDLWPRIAHELPEARLHVVGASSPEWLMARRDRNVEIHDSISDAELHELYRRCRAAVVPLRFGAGAKGKTIEAMQQGVALVTTSVGVEGLPRDENLPQPADDANEFVDQVVRYCRDDSACRIAVQRQRQYVRDYFSRAAARSRLERILQAATEVDAEHIGAPSIERSGWPVRQAPESNAVIPRTTVSRPLDLDIGVIYTHEREFIGPLLESLAVSGPGLRTRLWLIDNQSVDGSEQWAALFPNTQILHNHRRLNYAQNLNRVLEAATARYMLLLNTDMVFDSTDRCLSRMVSFMDRNPGCGLATCRLLHPDGSEAHAGRRQQTLGVIAARRLGLGRLGRRAIDRYLCLDHQDSESHECDWVSGCFMLLRREAAEQVGLFDTRFGKYFEDVDMALRVRRAGWSVMQYRGTKCFHWEQRGSVRIWSRDAWRHLRAYGIWLRKWGLAPQGSSGKLPRPRLEKRAA